MVGDVKNIAIAILATASTLSFATALFGPVILTSSVGLNQVAHHFQLLTIRRWDERGRYLLGKLQIGLTQEPSIADSACRNLRQVARQ